MIEIKGTIPNPEKFRVETTTIDGRGRAFLACIRCSSYGQRMNPFISGRIGDLFSASRLDVILAVAASHECPEEVTSHYAKESR